MLDCRAMAGRWLRIRRAPTVCQSVRKQRPARAHAPSLGAPAYAVAPCASDLGFGQEQAPSTASPAMRGSIGGTQPIYSCSIGNPPRGGPPLSTALTRGARELAIVGAEAQGGSASAPEPFALMNNPVETRGGMQLRPLTARARWRFFSLLKESSMTSPWVRTSVVVALVIAFAGCESSSTGSDAQADTSMGAEATREASSDDAADIAHSDLIAVDVRLDVSVPPDAAAVGGAEGAYIVLDASDAKTADVGASDANPIDAVAADVVLDASDATTADVGALECDGGTCTCGGPTTVTCSPSCSGCSTTCIATSICVFGNGDDSSITCTDAATCSGARGTTRRSRVRQAPRARSRRATWPAFRATKERPVTSRSAAEGCSRVRREFRAP